VAGTAWVAGTAAVLVIGVVWLSALLVSETRVRLDAQRTL